MIESLKFQFMFMKKKNTFKYSQYFGTWLHTRDSDVVPMSDSHNNMIAYGFNDVTFGGDLTEAMISLRLRMSTLRALALNWH